MRVFAYLLMREIWEHKGLWIAPLLTAALVLVSALWGAIALVGSEDALAEIDQQMGGMLDGQGRALIYATVLTVASVVFAVMLAVIFFYLLDCLYAERKDRSILFWRSLPVSDARTVLSKLAVSLVVAPAIVLATVLVYLVFHYVLLGSVLVLGTDLAAGDFFRVGAATGALVSLTSLMLYAGLWFLPVYGWLLLVSAWARRAPFLWAVLVPAGVMIFERIALGSHEFARMLGGHLAAAFDYRATGWAAEDGSTLITEEGLTETIYTWPIWLDGLSQPALWVGLMIGAAFVTGAVMIRRFRGETA